MVLSFSFWRRWLAICYSVRWSHDDVGRTYGSNYGSFFVNSPKIWCRLLPFCATEALYLCFFGDNNAFSHLLLPRVQLVVSVSLSDELHAISGPRKFTDMRIHYYICQWALVIITNCTRVVCKLTRVSRKRGGSRRSTCRRSEPQRERENTFKEPNKVCLHKIAECVVQDLHPPSLSSEMFQHAWTCYVFFVVKTKSVLIRVFLLVRQLEGWGGGGAHQWPM